MTSQCILLHSSVCQATNTMRVGAHMHIKRERRRETSFKRQLRKKIQKTRYISAGSNVVAFDKFDCCTVGVYLKKKKKGLRLCLPMYCVFIPVYTSLDFCDPWGVGWGMCTLHHHHGYTLFRCHQSFFTDRGACDLHTAKDSATKATPGDCNYGRLSRDLTPYFLWGILHKYQVLGLQSWIGCICGLHLLFHCNCILPLSLSCDHSYQCGDTVTRHCGTHTWHNPMSDSTFCKQWEWANITAHTFSCSWILYYILFCDQASPHLFVFAYRLYLCIHSAPPPCHRSHVL